MIKSVRSNNRVGGAKETSVMAETGSSNPISSADPTDAPGSSTIFHTKFMAKSP